MAGIHDSFVPAGTNFSEMGAFPSAKALGYFRPPCQAAFEKLQQEYPKIVQWKGRVGESAQTPRNVLEFEKALGLTIERLGHYAMLQTSGDSSDNAHLAREGQLENLFTLIGESQSF